MIPKYTKNYDTLEGRYKSSISLSPLAKFDCQTVGLGSRMKEYDDGEYFKIKDVVKLLQDNGIKVI